MSLIEQQLKKNMDLQSIKEVLYLKELRIIEIPGIDIEACGGTHAHATEI